MTAAEAAHTQIPYTAGMLPPQVMAPPNACDCHHHIITTGPVRDIPPERSRPLASVANYRRLQKRLRTTRNVVVNASNYDADNQETIAALEQFGDGARGIVVVPATISDDTLKHFHDKGVRGIRFVRAPWTPWDDVKLLASRVADLGWHVQFNVELADIVEQADLLNDLPTDVVLDHLARVQDVNGPDMRVILRLLDKGKTWIKLSGFCLMEPQGAPAYAKSVAVAKAYVEAAPERLVWGTDWPHPSAKVAPDDALMFDLNREWAPTEAQRELILVRNPEILYGFGRTG